MVSWIKEYGTDKNVKTGSLFLKLVRFFSMFSCCEFFSQDL